MAQPRTTRNVSAPSGFPVQGDIPVPDEFEGQVLEPTAQQRNLPSRPIPDFNYYPSQTPAMDAYYESAMNPPVRQPNSALRMVGTGLLSALQDSTGPKSRKPLYNAAGKVVGSREAGFWESLGNNPFDVDEASHIADIPYNAQVADYGMKMKGLGTAATLESNYPARQALAFQRTAAGLAKPREVAVKEGNLDRLNYLASLKMSDQQLEAERQAGRITLQEAKDLAAMNRTQAQQAGATTRTGMQQAGATTRTGMQTTARTGDVQTQQEHADYRARVMATAQAAAGGGVFMGNDPDNPGGPKVAMFMNPRTGQVEKAVWDEQAPGSPGNVPPSTTPQAAPAQPGMGAQGAIPPTASPAVPPQAQPIVPPTTPPKPVTGLEKPGTPPKDAGIETPQEIARLQSMRANTQEALDLIDRIYDEDTKKLNPQAEAAVGKSFMAGYVPTTDAFSGRKDITKLKDMLTLSIINEMKRQSKTGATGFGAMNRDELAVLVNAASKLDPMLDSADFIEEVQRIQEKLRKVMKPGTLTTQGAGGQPQQTRQRVKTPQGDKIRVSTDGGKTWQWEK